MKLKKKQLRVTHRTANNLINTLALDRLTSQFKREQNVSHLIDKTFFLLRISMVKKENRIGGLSSMTKPQD